MAEVSSEKIDYDINALKEGINKARKNIKIFEEAIINEESTMREYARMIRVLEEKLIFTTNKEFQDNQIEKEAKHARKREIMDKIE